MEQFDRDVHSVLSGSVVAALLMTLLLTRSLRVADPDPNPNPDPNPIP